MRRLSPQAKQDTEKPGKSFNRFVRQYRSDTHFRVHTMLWVSFFIHILFAAFALLGAIQRTSFWEGALSVYHLSLCTLYVFLVCRQSAGTEIEYPRQLRTARLAGLLLIILDFVLGGIMIQVIRFGRSYIYPGYWIYGGALLAFCSLTFAVLNILRYRKLNNPIFSAVGAVNLTVSLMSIFGLETALVTRFGSGDTSFREIITAITAAAVFVCVLVIAVRTIARSRKLLKKSPGTMQTDQEENTR